jgi:hypothetical protein
MTRPRELRGPGKIYRGLLRRLLRSAAAHITVATTTATASAATTTFAGTFVEFLAATTTAAASTSAATTTQVFTLRTSAAHFGLAAAAGHDAHAAALLLGIRRAGAIARSERDLEFIEFVPLGIGPIAIGDGQQFLHALAR